MIELRSESDRLVDLQEKMQEYLGNGAQLGWLVDPLRKQVHIYRLAGAPVILDAPASLSGDRLLPGFTLGLSRIMDDG